MQLTNPRGLFARDARIDGYCPHCAKETTFTREHVFGLAITDDQINSETRYSTFQLVCVRKPNHILRFNTRFGNWIIQKVGQYPSFADIAIDESKAYTKLLKPEDAREFHKAIGLASHGVGIGSFVYLRRIFERLIHGRYNEFKDAEGWKDEEWNKLRMAERIQFLKNHLPEFLVQNARLYSIMSVGVHELDEKKCLAFFPVLRQSTIWILEQDKKKQEELAQQKALAAEIAKFDPKISE